MGIDRAGKEDTGMSQEEALNWLAAHPGWHKTVVIARGLRKRRHQVGPILTLEGLIEERRADEEVE